MAPFPRWLRVLGVVVSLIPVLLGLALLLVGLQNNHNAAGWFALIGIGFLLIDGWLVLVALAWGLGWRYAPALNALGLLGVGLYLALSSRGGGAENNGLMLVLLLWPLLPLLAWGMWRLGEVARRETGKREMEDR